MRTRFHILALFLFLVTQPTGGFAWSQVSSSEYQQLAQLTVSVGSDLAWSPEGTHIAVVDYPAIRIFDVTSWQEALVIPDAETSGVVWNPDGTQIASVRGGNNEFPYESLFIRSSYTGNVLMHLRRPFERSTDHAFILPLLRLSWSPDGTTIATDSHSLDVLIWITDERDVQVLGSYQSGRVGETDWSPDSTQVVSEGGDGTIRVWDVATRSNLLTIDAGGGTVDWHPSDNRIVGSTIGGKVSVWNSDTGQEVRTINHGASVLLVRWNHDGSRIATGGLDGIIKIWDAETGSLISTIEEHTELITALAWHPNKNRLASSSLDGDVRIWRLNN